MSRAFRSAALAVFPEAKIVIDKFQVVKVIIEAREAGKEVGIFDPQGNILQQELNNLVAGVEDINVLIWEAPMKKQQQELILLFGNNVNLGNIPPDEILALEALRQGLRGDTLKRAYEEDREP